MRHEYLSVYNLSNHKITSDQISVGEISVGGGGYLLREHDFASDGKDSGSYELFTISGAVRVKLLPICVTNLVSKAGNNDSKLYLKSGAISIIGKTSAADIDADEAWVSNAAATMLKVINTSAILDKVLPNQTEIRLFIDSEAMTTGVINFHCWWEPIDEGATLVVA